MGTPRDAGLTDTGAAEKLQAALNIASDPSVRRALIDSVQADISNAGVGALAWMSMFEKLYPDAATRMVAIQLTAIFSVINAIERGELDLPLNEGIEVTSRGIHEVGLRAVNPQTPDDLRASKEVFERIRARIAFEQNALKPVDERAA